MDGFLSITHPLALAAVFHTAYSTISADGRKVTQITLGRADWGFGYECGSVSTLVEA